MGERSFHKAAAFVFLAILTTGAAFFQQAGSGMVGFWRLEESASPSMDSSGNNFTSNAWPAGVTSLPGPANTPAALGASSAACVSLNGTTGVISVPSNPALTITGDFTVAIWVYKQADATDWVRIIGKGASAVRTFGVWEEPNAAGRILFQQYNGTGGAVLSYYSTGSIPLTTWTHVACRMSGNNATIFINGANSGAGTRTATPGSDASDLTLGYAGFHTYWNGRLDDARLYNRALADAEIAALAAGSQGPAAPTGLTATAGSNQVMLNWSASGATVFNVKRATVSGGPYMTVQSNVATNSFTDTTTVNGTTYYYVVSGVSYGEGPNSNQASATPLPVTALPNTGLSTSETGGSTSFTIRYNSPAPPGGSILQVASNNVNEGVVSTTFPGATPIANGFQINVAATTSPVITVAVTGVDDPAADGNTAYMVTVTETGFGFAIPNVNLTNVDDDTPNVFINRTSGLVTTESGGQDTFSVSLTTRPYGTITMGLSSSDTAEGTVSPAGLTFNSANWNTPQVVTVTGVDDMLLDFGQFFTVVTTNLNAPNAQDAPYDNMVVSDVSVLNMDNETIPALEPVWGGGGGCGFLGLEIALPLLLLRLVRRRKFVITSGGRLRGRDRRCPPTAGG